MSVIDLNPDRHTALYLPIWNETGFDEGKHSRGQPRSGVLKQTFCMLEMYY